LTKHFEPEGTRSHFQPKDPDFAAKVRASFARQAFMTHLGARLVTVEAGHVEIEVDYRKELTQQHEYIHAGVTGSIVDTACGYAAYTLQPPETTVLTVEYKLNLLRPAVGEKLLASARVLRAGKSITVCQGEVFAIQGGQRTLCAATLATIMTLAGQPDTPAKP
jgi:uncharacterized protein (TIGR00369 family)